jgi:hypothetical protein
MNAKLNRLPRWCRVTLAILLGACAGICLHYVLYRLSLPSKPFIYVAF